MYNAEKKRQTHPRYNRLVANDNKTSIDGGSLELRMNRVVRMEHGRSCDSVHNR